jgi:GMP synthase-like glutamine amidotransferase
MKIDVVQHVPFEGPAAVADWARSRERELRTWAAYEGALPAVDDLDFLVIMGGPMNIYQEAEHPWLAQEKALIKAALEKGAAVLGICLGAQLLADALGGEITRNEQVEIGWFPVEITKEGHDLEILDGLATRFIALHWHGDTFSIPEDAVHFASSVACKHQAFAYDDGRVMGLQFHLEETRESLALLIEHARGELVPGDWIQSERDLLAPYAPFDVGNEFLFRLLDRMTEKVGAEQE